jgi:hypothetical protein
MNAILDSDFRRRNSVFQSMQKLRDLSVAAQKCKKSRKCQRADEQLEAMLREHDLKLDSEG